MRTRFFLFLLALVMVASVTAAPAYAQEKAKKSPFAPIGTFFKNLGSQAQRFYLRSVPGPKSGEEVLKQTLLASEDVTSVYFSSKSSFEAKKDGENVGGITLEISGPTEVKDVYDPKTSKQQLDLAGELSMQGTSLRARADVIKDGETVYFKLNEVPAIPVFDLSELKGEWLKMETPSDTTDEAEAEDELTAEQRQQLQQASIDLFKSAEVSQAKKEKKDGNNVFVIEVTFNDDDLLAYFKRVDEITAKDDDDKDSDTAQKDEESMRKTLEAMEPVKAIAWVNQGDFRLRHLELPLTVDLKKLDQDKESESEDTTGGATLMQLGDSLKEADTLTISITADFDKYNEPVTIELPESSRDAQEAFQELLSNAMGGALVSQQRAIQQQQLMEQQLKAQEKMMRGQSVPGFPGQGYGVDDVPVEEDMLEDLGY